MINLAALMTAAFALFISLMCFLKFGTDVAISCLFGGGVVLLNLLGLGIIWKFIFSKKSIALVVSVIIFKYLILGLILWNLNQIQWMRPIGFVFGLSSLVLGILGSLVVKKYFAKKI